MEKELARAARRAIDELELPCEVSRVSRLSDGGKWCIQFTPGYGQLAHSFRAADGQRYTESEILETIRQHLSLMEEMRTRPSER